MMRSQKMVVAVLLIVSLVCPCFAQTAKSVAPSEHSQVPLTGNRLLSLLVQHQQRQLVDRPGLIRSQGLICNEPRVVPPAFLDISRYTPVEQAVFGLVSVLLEDLGAGLENLMKSGGGGSGTQSCQSCFCSVVHSAEDLSKTVTEFKAMINGFSMSKARAALGDLAALVRQIEASLHPCGLSQERTEELIAAAAGWLTGLEEVIQVVDLALKGVKIYCEADALVTAWENEDWFNVGVNIGRLVNIAVSVAEGGLMFSRTAAPASVVSIHARGYGHLPAQVDPHAPPSGGDLVWAQDSCVLRHPGGGWETCECGQSLDRSRYFGNYCKSVQLYIASVSAGSGDPASHGSSGLSGGAVAGIIAAAAFVAVAAFLVGFKIAMKKSERRYSAIHQGIPLHVDQDLSASLMADQQ